MNTTLKYGLLASLLLWPCLAGAIAVSCERLPTSDPVNPYAEPYDDSHNWVGHGAGAVFGYALLLLVFIYTAKFLIGRLPVQWLRVYYFVLLVTASLPWIWFLVVLDWRNWHVYRLACGIYDPIGVWFIPTISFTADTVALRSNRSLRYVGRSCIEFALMFPWMFVWSLFPSSASAVDEFDPRRKPLS